VIVFQDGDLDTGDSIWELLFNWTCTIERGYIIRNSDAVGEKLINSVERDAHASVGTLLE